MIEAITFDFWDTIAVDDSDEPARRALGLPSKAEARIELFARHITQKYPDIAYEQAVQAYQHANQSFQNAWHHEQHTPGIAVRMYDAYDFLGLKPGPGRFSQLVREVNELIREIETMEVRIQPDFTPGVHAALEELSLHYKLGIISDTIHTTGRGLRYLLQRQGLLRYFSYMLFSDEIGVAKPEAEVFRKAALGLRTAPNRIVHVGDRESNDILGPPVDRYESHSVHRRQRPGQRLYPRQRNLSYIRRAAGDRATPFSHIRALQPRAGSTIEYSYLIPVSAIPVSSVLHPSHSLAPLSFS